MQLIMMPYFNHFIDSCLAFIYLCLVLMSFPTFKYQFSYFALFIGTA